MADLEIVPRGPGFATGAGQNTGRQSAVLADDVSAGDYVLALSSVDFVPATNPEAAECPIVPEWTELAHGSDPESGTGNRNMQIRAWLGRVATGPTTAASRTVTVTQSGESGQVVLARAYYGGSTNAVIEPDGPAAAIADRSSPFPHSSATATGSHDLLVVAFAAIRFVGGAPALAAPDGMTGWSDGDGSYHTAQVCTEHRTAPGPTGTRAQTDISGGGSISLNGAGIRFLLRAQGDPDAAGPPPGQFLPLFGR